jgi:glycosyltransferase involved in cell wall biosynthesis
MKKLSVVIPVYNEKNTIEEILKRVEGVDLGGLEKEIILIDDFSTDGTRQILEKYKGKYQLIFLDKNYGKGKAVREGFKKATGELVIIQDADLEYNPNDWPKLIKPILENEAEVVFGSRFLGEAKLKNRIVYKRGYIFSRFLNWFSNFLSGLWLSDVYSGYKVFSRQALNKILPRLVSNRLG